MAYTVVGRAPNGSFIPFHDVDNGAALYAVHDDGRVERMFELEAGLNSGLNSSGLPYAIPESDVYRYQGKLVSNTQDMDAATFATPANYTPAERRLPRDAWWVDAFPIAWSAGFAAMLAAGAAASSASAGTGTSEAIAQGVTLEASTAELGVTEAILGSGTSAGATVSGGGSTVVTSEISLGGILETTGRVGTILSNIARGVGINIGGSSPLMSPRTTPQQNFLPNGLLGAIYPGFDEASGVSFGGAPGSSGQDAGGLFSPQRLVLAGIAAFVIFITLAVWARR